MEHSQQILELKTNLASFADHNDSSSLFLSTSQHFASNNAEELRAELEVGLFFLVNRSTG